MLMNQTPKYPGKHKRQILAKGADNISEGLFCESSYTTSIAFPPKITVYTVVMWPEPVRKDPEFKIRMKAPICFQIAEKLEKVQSSQMQNHLLFQHLRAHFSFYDPFGKQCLLQRTKIILPSGTPRHGSGPRSKSPASDLCDVTKLNEGDMYHHALNTPLDNVVRQQPFSKL